MQYKDSNANPFSPPIEEVIIILPLFFLSIKGMTVLQTRNAERTLMSIK